VETLKPRPAWQHWLAGLALIALGFWLNAARLPLFDLDEGAFAQATLEMRASGNVLSTTLDGAPRYDKPPLTYWLQAISVSMFGVQPLAFRLPSLLAASVWVLYLCAFVQKRHGWRAAQWLALLLTVTPLPMLIARAAIADALLNLWLTLALLNLYRYREQPTLLPLLAAYGGMALSVLTKGPIGVALPVLISFLFFTLEKQFTLWLKAAFNLWGWLLFLGMVGAWAWPCWQADDGAWIKHFLFDHNLNRYQTTLQGHGGKPWYYLLVLPLALLPFTGGLWALKPASAQLTLVKFGLIWFAVVLGLFSFSRTQLPHYLLYGLPGLWLALSVVWSVGWSRSYQDKVSKALWLSLGVWILLLGGLMTTAAQGWLHSPRLHEQAIYARLAAWSWQLWLAPLLLCCWLAGWKNPSFAAFASVSALASLLISTQIAPALAFAQQQPIQHAATWVGSQPAVAFETYFPSFSVARGAPTPHRLPKVGEYVLLRVDKADKLKAALPNAHFQPVLNEGAVLLWRRLR
jgi:4-amino-4-deoxy-L-arabinose transferase-like glycosyltransferase